MACNNCNKNNDMAQIPYIEHERRMFKAYQREKRLKILLFGTNISWLFIAALMLCVR